MRISGSATKSSIEPRISPFSHITRPRERRLHRAASRPPVSVSTKRSRAFILSSDWFLFYKVAVFGSVDAAGEIQRHAHIGITSVDCRANPLWIEIERVAEIGGRLNLDELAILTGGSFA